MLLRRGKFLVFGLKRYAGRRQYKLVGGGEEAGGRGGGRGYEGV